MRSISILSVILGSLLVVGGCSKNEEESTTGSLMEKTESTMDAAAGKAGEMTTDAVESTKQAGNEAMDKAGEMGAMETGEPAATGDEAATTLDQTDTMIEGSGN